MPPKLFLTAWFAAVVLMAWASLTPSLAPPSEHHFDKDVHVLVYFALSVAPLLVLKRPRSAFVLATVLVTVGLLVEVGQSHVPGRVGSAGDALANAAGVLGGWAFAASLRRRHRFRHAGFMGAAMIPGGPGLENDATGKREISLG